MTAATVEPLEKSRPDRSFVPWHRWIIPRRRTVVIVLVMMLLSPVAVRWYRLWRVPNVPVPFDVEEFLAFPYPEDQNAFYYFEKAAVLGQGIRPQQELVDQFTEQGQTFGWQDVQEDQRPWVEKGTEALTIFRQGARCPAGTFHVPREGYVEAVVLRNSQLDELFWLAVLEALRQIDAGHPDKAADVLHDAFRASRLWGNKGWLTERQGGRRYHGIAARGWHEWTRQPQLTAEELETAWQRIQSDWELTLRPSEMLKADYLIIHNYAKLPLTMLRKEWHTDIDRWWRLNVLDERIKPRLDQWEAQCPGWQLPILWTLGEPEIMQQAAKLRMTHDLKTCDLPLAKQPTSTGYPLWLRRTDDLTAGLTADELHARLQLSPLLWHLGGVESTYQLYWSEAAQQALLETEFQLQMMFRRRGIHSRTAAEPLLAEFDWPIDPCSQEGAPLQYRTTDAGLLIWSLGWDLTDQGGKQDTKSAPVDLLLLIPWPTEQP